LFESRARDNPRALRSNFTFVPLEAHVAGDGTTLKVERRWRPWRSSFCSRMSGNDSDSTQP
jgi:hypothetical protein